MAKIVTQEGIEIELTPWTNNGCNIRYLQLTESLGGNIAEGRIELWQNGNDEALKDITETLDGTLLIKNTVEGGQCYEIPIFVVNRNFLNNVLTLDVKCIKNKEFFTKTVEVDYSDITDAINNLYKGSTDIRTDSNITNGLKVWQFGDNSYDLCTRLAWSFKKDIIFGYGFDRFILKDLIGTDSKGQKEPSIEITDTLMKRLTPYKLDFHKEMNYKPYDTWEKNYSDSSKVNPVVFINCDEIKYCHKDYNGLLENYMWNTNRFRSGYYSKATIKSSIMPDYRLGDIVKYKSNDQKSKYPFEVYVVASNEIFYSTEGTQVDSSGLNFSWTTTLFGLDRGEWNDEENKE